MVTNCKVYKSSVAICLLLLLFLSSFYVCTTLLLSVVYSFNLRCCFCTSFVGYLCNVNKVCKAFLVKACTKLVTYFNYKKRQSCKVIKQSYSSKVNNID